MTSGPRTEVPIKEFVDPPTPMGCRAIRLASLVVAAWCVGGVVFTAITGDPVGMLPLIATLFVWPMSNTGFVPGDVAKTVRYSLRYAWLGARAKPERLLAARHAAQLRAERADAAAVAATPGWVQAGMPAERAPRADYAPSSAAAGPTSVELTGQHLATIAHFTDSAEPLLLPIGAKGMLGPEAWRAEIDELVGLGILRRTRGAELRPGWQERLEGAPRAGDAELTPRWLPLLGAARFATLRLVLRWTDGANWHRIECLAGAGAIVEVIPDVPVLSVEIPGGPGTRYRLVSTSAEGLVERVLAALAVAAPPIATGGPPLLHLTCTRTDASIQQWIEVEAHGVAMDEPSAGDARRHLSAPEFADWLRRELRG